MGFGVWGLGSGVGGLEFEVERTARRTRMRPPPLNNGTRCSTDPPHAPARAARAANPPPPPHSPPQQGATPLPTSAPHPPPPPPNRPGLGGSGFGFRAPGFGFWVPGFACARETVRPHNLARPHNLKATWANGGGGRRRASPRRRARPLATVSDAVSRARRRPVSRARRRPASKGTCQRLCPRPRAPPCCSRSPGCCLSPPPPCQRTRSERRRYPCRLRTKTFQLHSLKVSRPHNLKARSFSRRAPTRRRPTA